MGEKPTPNWQPLSRLPLITSMIDGMVADATKQYRNLQEARPRPYILDDYTINRVQKVFTDQQDGLWLFDEQIQRWKGDAPTSEQHQELERLTAQLAQLRGLLKDILALAEELKQGTIEKILGKSDLEVGLEALLGNWPTSPNKKPRRSNIRKQPFDQ